MFDYDLRGRSPSVQFRNVDATDPADMQFILSSLHQILNNDDETYGYIDAERQLDFGPLKSVKFGAKYTDHNRELIFNATTYGRLPRSDQYDAGARVRGRADARQLPQQHRFGGHAESLLPGQSGLCRQHPVR